MNGKKIKKYWWTSTTIIFIVASIYYFYSVNHRNETYSLEVIETESGYGYTISKNQKVFIYQPFIPAISEKQSFLSKEDAISVGKLIIERLKSGESHAITQNDLKNLKIHHY